MAEDLGEKTEDATPRRLQEAREDGNVARSQDLAAGLLLLALNLYTFPTAPHYAGLVDLGPLVAVWYLVVFVWMPVIARRPGEPG